MKEGRNRAAGVTNRQGNDECLDRSLRSAAATPKTTKLTKGSLKPGSLRSLFMLLRRRKGWKTGEKNGETASGQARRSTRRRQAQEARGGRETKLLWCHHSRPDQTVLI